MFGINSCGNGNESNLHLVTIITSLAELYGMELKIYPNPSSGKFTLEIYGDEENKFDMSVLDLFGREIYTTQISEHKNQLNFGNFPNGMYYLVLKNEKVKLIERFVIVK